MDAKKQNLGGLDSIKKPSVVAATQDSTHSNLPRMDFSDYGAWGAKVDESRDLADKHGLTEGITKMAVSGKTAIEIAQAMKERLEAVNPAVEGENPIRENSLFVRRVRTSLGVPSVENTQDAALFEDWKAKVEARLNASSASEAAAGAAPENPNSSMDTGKATPETIIIDQATKDRLAGLRARDSAQAKESLGLNSIEPDLERKQQKLDDEKEEAKRAAWLKKADQTRQEAPPKKSSDNKVESDEVFTATQEAKPLVPKEVERQYLRVGDKYYHPKNADVLAFEDKGNKLETRSNSEQIAESMVRIAEARGWDEIKVSGSETFRREVWLEAASRGMHVKGYEPSEQDKAHLAKRSNDRQPNHVKGADSPAKAKDFRVGENDPDKTVPVRDDSGKVVGQETKDAKRNTWNVQMAESFAKEPPTEAVKKYPELAGAYATVAAIDKKAEADGLDERQRAVVNAKVRELVTNSIERGDIPNTKLREDREVTRPRSNERDYSR